MNKLLILSLVTLFLFSCAEKKSENQKVTRGEDMEKATLDKDLAAEVNFPVYNFDELEPMLHKDDDKTYVINFWATWCKPCIKELPYLERINEEQKDNNVEVVLVNLDLPNMWKSRLEPFVENRKIQSKVVILDDPKLNEWIPKVSEVWGGGIPATLIYNKDKRSFFEKGFTYEELNEELNKFIK